MKTEVNKNTKVKELAALGFFEEDGVKYPCAQIRLLEESVNFNAPFIAASLVALSNAFLDYIPEGEEREKFAKDTFYCYQKMFEYRKEYERVIVKNDNNQEPQV